MCRPVADSWRRKAWVTVSSARARACAFSPDSIGVAGILACLVLGFLKSLQITDHQLVITAMYLAIAALLVGYIGEREKARRGRIPDAAVAAGLRRARARARSFERARIARELHDGVVQSLSAAELRMDVIRRQVAAAAPQQADALLDIQERFRDDVKHLRLLTRRMQMSRASSLRDILAGLIDQFRRETGMSVTFACEQTSVGLSAPARHEIGRIVQEALVNIRKHSRARHVAVRARIGAGRWVISIEDDGRGFPFRGRWSHWQLDEARQGPFVIKQRARALRATLSLESIPGKGARLELGVPLRS
jgi:signal transduction histidine kinase